MNLPKLAGALSLAAMSCFISHQAHAETETPYTIGTSSYHAEATLDFGSSARAFFNAVGIGVLPLPPGKVEATHRFDSRLDLADINPYTEVRAIMPVTSIGGTARAGYFTPPQVLDTVDMVRTSGGFSLQLFSDTFGTSGQLDVSNLRIDLAGKTVYADLDGRNGIGTHHDVAFLSFSGLEGLALADTRIARLLNDCPGGCGFGPLETSFTLTGLRLAGHPAVNILGQSLGLNEDGMAAAAKLMGSGVGTLSVVVSVPEPAALAYAGMGLVALLLARSRRRQAASPTSA